MSVATLLWSFAAGLGLHAAWNSFSTNKNEKGDQRRRRNRRQTIKDSPSSRPKSHSRSRSTSRHHRSKHQRTITWATRCPCCEREGQHVSYCTQPVYSYETYTSSRHESRAYPPDYRRLYAYRCQCCESLGRHVSSVPGRITCTIQIMDTDRIPALPATIVTKFRARSGHNTKTYEGLPENQ